MTDKAAIPPKDQWKVYSVPVVDLTYGTVYVRAPSPEFARERVQRYLDNYEDDWQAFDFGDRGDGSVVVEEGGTI